MSGGIRRVGVHLFEASKMYSCPLKYHTTACRSGMDFHLLVKINLQNQILAL